MQRLVSLLIPLSEVQRLESGLQTDAGASAPDSGQPEGSSASSSVSPSKGNMLANDNDTLVVFLKSCPFVLAHATARAPHENDHLLFRCIGGVEAVAAMSQLIAALRVQLPKQQTAPTIATARYARVIDCDLSAISCLI